MKQLFIFFILNLFFTGNVLFVTKAYTDEVSLKWTKTLSNRYFDIISSPSLADDGTIYYAGVFCLHAINKDGTEKWSFKTCENSIGASTTIADDGTIYLGSYDQSMYAINPDGTKKWSYYTPAEIHVTPALGKDGVLYFGNGSNNESLYALNSDGTLKWKASVGRIASSPAIGKDNTIYVMTGDGNFACGLNAVNADGSIKWYFPFSSKCWTISVSPENSSPAIDSKGTIYIGNGNNLYAINPNGTLRWIYETGGHISSSPVINSDNTIFFGSEDKYFFAINSVDGSLKWHFLTEEIINSTPIIGSDGIIYVVSGGVLYAFNADGSLRWTYEVTDDWVDDDLSSPVIDNNGTLYIGIKERFIALNVNSKGIAQAPWPMFCRNQKHTNFADISSNSNPKDPVYNSTGIWNYSTSNVNNNCPGETNKIETGTVELVQNNNSVILTYKNRNYNGSVDHLTYEISDSYSYNDGIKNDNWFLLASSDTNASGSFFGTWSNGSISCKWSGNIVLNKKSNDTSQSNNSSGSNGDGGSGGGCFISVIKK